MPVGRPSTERSRPRPPPTLLHEIHMNCCSRCRHLQAALIPVPSGDIMSDLESSRGPDRLLVDSKSFTNSG